MKLGTAKITTRNGLHIVRYMNIGSFLEGEQIFGNRAAALRFCQERGLKVENAGIPMRNMRDLDKLMGR
jgi:hypothetical protein